jgi:anti-sigma regulatory factor (Ser/Thr protein kinase)
MTALGTFEPTTSSVGHVRRLAVGALDGLSAATVDDVALVVSELAANAVRHGRTPYTVSITQQPGTVRVEVQDRGGGSPVMRHPEATAIGGRGLQIVDAVSRSWGVERVPDGKFVWAELRAERPRATPPSVAAGEDDRLRLCDQRDA